MGKHRKASNAIAVERLHAQEAPFCLIIPIPVNLDEQVADRPCLPLPFAAERRQRFGTDMSSMIMSRLFREEEGDDEHQNRQDDEDAPGATEADHLSADGEVKPHHQDGEQEDENTRRSALGPSRR
jgi:hypothetical protein